ncbi:hypothetical protein IFM89_002219 [Coptis chinensis]|uniref:Uncharacterized protein n=1 Tax=Coptis chinensis TaxID=261450 RepID=A0A835IJW1_9MAGN|nr:hypothetical protein IFM89_002219 [Coptis chinensis]
MGPRKEQLTPRVKKEKKATQEVVEKSAPSPRKQYAAWRLLSKRTGYGVDFVGGVFEFPDEVWDDLIEKYPLTGQFRHAPLANRELLESLFEPTLASGDEMFNHKHPIPMTNPPNDHVAKVQNIESDGDEDNQIHGADYFPNVTIYEDYDPYTSQDVPMDDTQYNPSHDILSDNEKSPTYAQNTPADGPPNQR